MDIWAPFQKKSHFQLYQNFKYTNIKARDVRKKFENCSFQPEPNVQVSKNSDN